MKKLLFSLFALALCSSFAMADVPSSEFSSVSPADALNGVILGPDETNLLAPIPASIYTVTVKNSNNNPINNAAVVISFTANNVICTNAVLTGNTNTSGIVTLTLAGGGCAHALPAAAVVKANGVTIRSYSNAKSPDFDGAAGNGSTNAADLTRFAAQFAGDEPPECHDYDNNATVNAGDLVVFSLPFSLANFCTLVP